MNIFKAIACFFKGGHNFSSQRHIYCHTMQFVLKGTFNVNGDSANIVREDRLVEVCSCCGKQGNTISSTSEVLKEVDGLTLRNTYLNLRNGYKDYQIRYAVHPKPEPTMEERNRNAKHLIQEAFNRA